MLCMAKGRVFWLLRISMFVSESLAVLLSNLPSYATGASEY